MGAPKPYDSIIATFDLLGISAIMNAASSDTIAEVTTAIDDAFSDVKTAMSRALEELQKTWVSLTGKRCATWEDLIKRTTVKFFSDTIVISLRRSKSVPLEGAMFITYVCLAMSRLFGHGFPCRCCVDVGQIVIKKNIILGRPYVRSLNCAENLDLCCAILTEEAYNLFLESLRHATINVESVTKAIRIDTLEVPTKTGPQNLRCLNWIADIALGQKINDLRQWLCETFSSHHKVMTNDAWRKLDNTERLIRSFLYHRQHTLPELLPCGNSSPV